MALTPEQIDQCEETAAISFRRHKGLIRGQQLTQADNYNWHLARAIEAEVRKEDTETIRQLVEALEYHRAQTRPIELTDKAITAGRARLGGKP